MKNKPILILNGILGLQGGIVNFNPESSRVANVINRHNPESRVISIANTNPESKAESIVNNHPKAVTAACVMWAKGVCIAVKAAKYATSAGESKSLESSGNTNSISK